MKKVLLATLAVAFSFVSSADEKKDYLISRQKNYDINRDKVKVARKQYRNQGAYIEDILSWKQ